MAESDDLDLIFTFFNEVGIIAQLSNNAFARTLPRGLNQSQFSVLNWFVRVDSVATPGRLSTAFMVTKGAMTYTLKKLQQKGLIDVRPDESSGRQKIVTMTHLGRQVRDEALKSASNLLLEVTRFFDLQDLKQQLPLLQEIRKFLDDRRYE